MNNHDNRFCLYLHTRPDTNQVFYVGIGVKGRPIVKSGRSNLWDRVVAKNNGDYAIDILCENQTWDSVCQMEKYLIRFFGRRNLGKGSLCNLTNGGDGTAGYTHSDETRKKQSIAAKKRPPFTAEHIEKLRINGRARKSKPETIAKLVAIHTGSKRTAETKALISARAKERFADPEFLKRHCASIKGKKVSPEGRRKMSEARMGVKYTREQKIIRAMKRKHVIQQICPVTTDVIATYLNICVAGRLTGIASPHISCAISGRYRTAGSFIWRKSFDLTDLDRLIEEQIAA